ETLDELGVGTIRDAFSDFFFPGTSTIQTRARYMLFIPWMYLDLEDQEVSSADISDRAREYEGDIIEALIRNCPDEGGIIGAQSGRSLRQMPSSIYWTGLASWGIRRFEGLRRGYHRQLDRFYARLDSRRSLDAEARRESAPPHNWHPKRPDPPDDWPDAKTLRLRRDEAVFLRDRIMEEHPDVLLARLIDLGFRDTEVGRLWMVPQLAHLSTELQEKIDRARSFAELMQAANLLYALVLAEMDESAESPDHYREQLFAWADANASRRSAHERNSNSEDWLTVQQRRPAGGALRFERVWRTHVLKLGDLSALVDDSAAKQMIREREARVKGRRARVHGGRRLERWTGSGAVGTLDFRWGTARRIIADIVEGLERDLDA
ncbi:MAG: DUF6361 family protein, partial [Armatimonadota bacterium]